MEKHGFSYDEEDDKPKRSRRISQTVKDKVWNRDGGKCVCGSNENIEFDHIVPFSKEELIHIEIFKYFVNPVTEENLIISDSTRIILILTMI